MRILWEPPRRNLAWGHLHVAQCFELQPPQEVEGLALTARLVPEKPKTEKMRAVCVPPQRGQAGLGSASLPRTNSSNVALQSVHLYSKIGTA